MVGATCDTGHSEVDFESLGCPLTAGTRVRRNAVGQTWVLELVWHPGEHRGHALVPTCRATVASFIALPDGCTRRPGFCVLLVLIAGVTALLLFGKLVLMGFYSLWPLHRA